MRWLVWWCACGLLACGKSASEPGTEAAAGAGGAAGGTGGKAATSGGSPSPGGGGGVPTSGAAGQSASAGAPSGGRSGTGGGTSGEGGSSAGGAGGSAAGAEGGSSGEAGAASAGESGDAGAPSHECGAYVACGCGCCAAEPGSARCYYPELGDELDAIRSEDEAASTSPSCANAGCSIGLRHQCCVKPISHDPAAYEGSTYIGGLNRVTVKRTGQETARCTRFTIVQLSGGSSEQFRIAVPAGWAVEVISDYACADESSAAADSRRYPIGGMGELRWASEAQCSVDIDVTLFFPSESGGVDAVWFDARGVQTSAGAPCE